MCRQLAGMPRSPNSQATWWAVSVDSVQKSHCMSLSRQLLSARADEVLKLHRITQEEHRGVVADDVQVALGGVETQRKPARIPPGVWAAALAGHGGKSDQCVGLRSGLKYRRAGVGADVVGHLEIAERAGALGVGLALGDAFPVKLAICSIR